MTDREKQSLKIRLGRRLSSDRPEVMEIVKEEINKTPKSISDLLQRPIGEWIKRIDNLFPEESTEECSICHEEQFLNRGNDDNFCPNCGAKMRNV